MLSLGLALLATGCGGSPAAPQSAATPALRIIADPVITVTHGTTVPLRIEELGPGGTAVEQPAANYAWTSSDPGLIDATGGVLRARSGFGRTTITARSATGASVTALVWVQFAENQPSTFRITLDYADDVPPKWRAALENAAARWQHVIRAELPPAAMPPVNRDCSGGDTPPPPMSGVERGTRIFVSVGTFSVTDRAEAVAVACTFRPLPHPTTLFGRIILNRSRLGAGGRRPYLALHEMGHVLGLAGNASRQMPWFDAISQRTRGPLALEGYRRVTGRSASFLAVTLGHWSEVYDVMMALGQNTHVSEVSVGALMDMGYPAAWYGADK